LNKYSKDFELNFLEQQFRNNTEFFIKPDELIKDELKLAKKLDFPTPD
jgi:hypothetical protein